MKGEIWEVLAHNLFGKLWKLSRRRSPSPSVHLSPILLSCCVLLIWGTCYVVEESRQHLSFFFFFFFFLCFKVGLTLFPEKKQNKTKEEETIQKRVVHNTNQKTFVLLRTQSSQEGIRYKGWTDTLLWRERRSTSFETGQEGGRKRLPFLIPQTVS